MLQLWWLQRNGRRRWITISKQISAVSGSKVTESKSTFKGHIVDWHQQFCLSMRVLFQKYAVSSAEDTKKVVKKLMFFAPQIRGKGPEIFLGGFLNRHHFRPTGQVWLRSHGWSFTYADEIKNKQITAVKYNGLAFGGHNNHNHFSASILGQSELASTLW